jgi:hypothetical protein
MHDDVKQVGNHLELFRGGQQITLSGEPIANVDPDYPVSKLFADFYDTELGDDFLETYGLDTVNPKTGETNAQVVQRAFMKLYGFDPRMTMSRIVDTIQTAISSGELTRLPEEVEALPVRNESGQFANALDLEIKHLIETNPAEIKRRSRVDRNFAAAVDRIMFPKTQAARYVESDPDLNIFAELYIRTPYSRPINGEYFFPDGFGGRRYSIAEYNSLVERCAAAKLIR